jgi:PHP family Zn ribbon phosphoesterase
VLSPCGDLEMSPRAIVEVALKKNLGIIGITDHNTTLQVEMVESVAARAGIFVMGGVEITTKEEVHCLAFFPDRDQRHCFQEYLDIHLPFVRNDESVFGFQVLADENDNIVGYENRLLITALRTGIDEIEKEVHRLGGIFIPAHIDRPVNSVFSQLGFIPSGLLVDGLEMTCFTTVHEVKSRFGLSNHVTLLQNSDAHYPEDIGKATSLFTIENCSFDEIRMALAGKEGRAVIPESLFAR